MNEYYFLSSLLPPLEIGHVPALDFKELKVLMEANLSSQDRKKVRHFLLQIDLENMRAYWSNEPFDPRGNLSKAQMESALEEHRWPSGESFPYYLSDYLDKYRSNEDRLIHFPLLISQFFNYMIEHEEGFLSDYFAFQKELRLVVVGFRAKKWGKNLAEQLQYEDPTDSIVAQILAQKDAKEYEPPFEYKELKPIFQEFGEAPSELNRALYEYQFKSIIELWGSEPFTIDRLLNYLARLILVERWLELDLEKGIQLVDRIQREIA